MKKALFLLVSLSAVACHKKISQPPTAPPPVVEAPKPSVPAEVPTPPASTARVIASLKKTGCFGQCPVFSATIWSDGRAEYLGEKWARRDGRFTATAKKAWLKNLLETAESVGYFGLAARYPISGADIPDLPVTTVFIESKGHFRQVEDHFDSPLSLRGFEKFFEEKLEEIDWQPTK